MWTTSIAGSAISSSLDANPRSAPSPSAAAAAASGLLEAIPASTAPLMRAARAWTPPMKPAPAMPTRIGSFSITPRATVIALSPDVKQKHDSVIAEVLDLRPITWFTYSGMGTIDQLAQSSPTGPGALLQLIRDGRATTRAELARYTGLARSTVAQRVEALLAADLLYEAGGSTSTGGRPPPPPPRPHHPGGGPGAAPGGRPPRAPPRAPPPPPPPP